MNRHFEDTLYYLKRAVKTAKKGVTEEAEPVESKVRELTGREKESEPGRIERVKANMKEAGKKARGEAKEAVRQVRETVGEYRGRRA